MSEGNKPADLASLHRRLDGLEHAVAQRVAETCAAVLQTPARTAGHLKTGLAAPDQRGAALAGRGQHRGRDRAAADYLYLAFTNAAAFSPTDVMPLSRWAKLAMTLQSVVSIVTVALIVARAVNILK